MGRCNKRDTRSRAARHFGSSPFTLVSDELRKSLAYKCLTPTARLVLIDMIGKYHLASQCDKEALGPLGFQYVFLRCSEPVSKNSFYEAVKQIVEHGFFACPPEIQPLSVARPARYLPSTAWRTWSNPDAEKKLRQREQRKENGIKRDQKRRNDYHRRDVPSEKDTE